MFRWLYVIAAPAALTPGIYVLPNAGPRSQLISRFVCIRPSANTKRLAEKRAACPHHGQGFTQSGTTLALVRTVPADHAVSIRSTSKTLVSLEPIGRTSLPIVAAIARRFSRYKTSIRREEATPAIAKDGLESSRLPKEQASGPHRSS